MDWKPSFYVQLVHILREPLKSVRANWSEILRSNFWRIHQNFTQNKNSGIFNTNLDYYGYKYVSSVLILVMYKNDIQVEK